jgi:hypothetical protein
MIFFKAFSQQSKPDLSKEKFTDGKYLVKIISVGDNGYGYEIFEGAERVVKQESKPYFSVPIPFSNMENTKIIARYHVKMLKEKKPEAFNMNVQRAKDLGVSEEDLQFMISPRNKN